VLSVPKLQSRLPRCLFWFNYNRLGLCFALEQAGDEPIRGAPQTMTPDSFATDPLPPRDQIEAWRAWFEPVLDVVPKQTPDTGFRAETHAWRLGRFAMSRTMGPPVTVVRTKRNLRREPVDHWVISYCGRGAHLAKTARTSIEVPARVPFVWSLGEEFEHERTHIDRIQFFMPRDVFRDIAPLLDAACGLVLDTPLGHLFGDYMLALERRLPIITQADFPQLESAVQAMVAAAVAPSAERVEIARRQIDLGLRERVRQAVRRHLRTPGLGPKTLCRLVGMSRSNLYRLFEEKGGVAQYIQSERLTEAYAILADPASIRTISALAEDLCFADASSFSRAFKRKFGGSPSEVRSAACAGVPPSAILQRRRSTKGSDFGDLFRAFAQDNAA